MKFLVTEIGKGNYGLGGTLLTRENLFSLGDGGVNNGGGGTNQNPRIISFNSGYDTGFTYNVYANWYFGNTYELTKTITLSPSDEFLDRIDVIVVDDSGDITVIEGTPAFNPVKPEINPLTQLEGTFIYIAALSDSPEGITTYVVYDEELDGEWVGSIPSGGASIVLDSTNNPFTGTYHIEGTNVALNKSIQFNNPTTDLEVVDVTHFSYRIQNKVSIAPIQGGTHRILLTGTTTTGSTSFEYLPLPSSVGYDSQNTTDYQFVSLPVPKTTSLVKINRVTFVCNVPTESLWGFNIDNIRFVGGLQENVTYDEVDPTVPAYTKTLDSAAKLLEEILTVDGSGSGLDADLLDGRDWTFYDHTIPGYITGITSNDGSVTIDDSTPGIYDLSVPTKVSELENDLGFITLSDIVSAGDSHFIDNFTWSTGQSQIFTLTHVPEKILVASVDGVLLNETQFSVDFENGAIEILDPLNDGDTFRVLYGFDNFSLPGGVDLNIPTHTSQLINDSGFITLADIVTSEDEHFIDNYIWSLGEPQVFTLTHTPEKVLVVSVNGQVLTETQFTVDFDAGTVEILNEIDDNDSVRVLYSYDPLDLTPAFFTDEFNYVLGEIQDFILTHVPNYILSVTVQGQMLAFTQYTVDWENKTVTINNELTDDDLVRFSYQYIPVAEGGTPPPPSTPTDPKFYGEEFVWTSPSPQTFTLLNTPIYIVNIAVQGQVLSTNQYTLDVGNNQFTIINELDENDLVKIIYQY